MIEVKLKILFLFVFFIFSTTTMAKNWVINKDHSEVLFEIPFLKVSNITGRFTEFKGQAYFANESDLVPTKINIEVSPASIFTGNKMRDHHLKGKDFFAVKQFPQIRFVAHKITQVAGNKFIVKGPLTIKNTTKEVQFIYTISDSIADTWNKKNRFIKYEAKITREQFGLDWNKVLKDNQYILGDLIKIKGNFQLQPHQQKTASSRYMIPNTKHTQARDNYRVGNIDETQLPPKPSLVAPRKEQKPLSLPTAHKKKSQKVNPTAKTETQDLYWWSAYITVGFFGFCGLIFLIAEFKKLFMKKSKNYSETNFIGLITDLPTILMGTIYAMAMWELMIVVR